MTVPVDEFARRAREWIAERMPPADPSAGHFFFTDPSSRTDDDDVARIDRCRELQRRLFDGGFAGICFPPEYGGLGLTLDHQRAFNAESAGYEMPDVIQIPTFVPCAAVLLEFDPQVDCGDAWAFRPQERHLGAIQGRALRREIGGLESQRRYELAFEEEGRPIYFIYNYKRGFFYPFVPAPGEKQRNNEREFQLKAQLGTELPIEPEMARWFPLWDIPL